MIGLLLALTLSWSPVVSDCAGGPESGVVYEVAYMYRSCQPEGPCYTFAVHFDTVDTKWHTEVGHVDPPVGAAYWYEVKDRDGAGNVSDQCQAP